MWLCGAPTCKTAIWLKCRSRGGDAASLQAQPALGIAAESGLPALACHGIEESESERIAESLWMKLKMLPPVLPCQTREKVPGRARKRIGRTMVKLMDKLMGLLKTAAAAPVEEALETATLCGIAYALVPRSEKMGQSLRARQNSGRACDDACSWQRRTNGTNWSTS